MTSYFTTPKESSMFTRDLLERVLRTFVATFLGTVGLAAATVVDVPSAKAAALAAGAAAVSAVIAVIAKQFGDPTSASFQSGV
jgi:RNase P/RNase MRP subunit POP5